jgi:HEPN domain-containing protein
MKPQEWLAEAQADQQRAQRSLAAEDWAGAAFHAQQCAEKALKGALWAHGFNSWGHDLRALLGRLVQSGLDPPAELVEHAQELEQHYFRSR